MSKVIRTILRILLPFLLGAGILYWIYRGTSWSEVSDVLTSQMDWGWMLLSLVFGILPQILRGFRWRLALEPLNERPRKRVCVYAVFVSYAASLIVPRIGELTRCGTLRRMEGTNFSKSFGAVVTERIVDSLCMLAVTGVMLLLQMNVFLSFFHRTGTRMGGVLSLLSNLWLWIILFCVCAIVYVSHILLRRSKLHARLAEILHNMIAGIASLHHMRSLPLYLLYSLLIWLCYYLHFSLTFYCFGFTSHLGPGEALAAFCAGSYAILIPTPNGAGPWHFAVKTMLILYGVTAGNAILFTLVVHALQTGLIILLGIIGLMMLSFCKRRTHTEVPR